MPNQPNHPLPESSPTPAQEPQRPRRQWLREVLWWGTFLLVAFAMRSSVASTYRVPSESMEPTIVPGDRLFANQAAFGLRLPFSKHRLTAAGMPSPGEIVIFPSPTDIDPTTRRPINLIKRVVAVGGDTIAVRRGRIILNGIPLALTRVKHAPPGFQRYREHNRNASYLVQWDRRHPNLREMAAVRVPHGHFFVMGDNRDYSGDSRVFGAISKDQLVARAMRHFYSLETRFPYIRWGRLLAPLK